MQILLNIGVTLALMFWPLLIMMSPMLFDAPGSENDLNGVSSALIFLAYPIFIFLLMGVFGARYFGLNSFICAAVSAAIIFCVFWLFGYFSMFSNLQKGIANSGYSITEKGVYYNAEKIEGADSESFTLYNKEDYQYDYSVSQYASDKSHFYFRGKAVEGVDPTDIEGKIIGYELYWLTDSQVIQGNKILAEANPQTFAAYDNVSGWTYSMTPEKSIIYSYGEVLKDVDFASFQPLSDFLGKDKQHIFKNTQVILSEADADTFQLLPDRDFGRDKNRVYYLATLNPFAIEGADPDSFEVLDRGYLKDKNHVYHVQQYESVDLMPMVDISSFVVTNYDEQTKSDAKDKLHFYYGGEVVPQQ